MPLASDAPAIDSVESCRVVELVDCVAFDVETNGVIDAIELPHSYALCLIFHVTASWSLLTRGINCAVVRQYITPADAALKSPYSVTLCDAEAVNVFVISDVSLVSVVVERDTSPIALASPPVVISFAPDPLSVVSADVADVVPVPTAMYSNAAGVPTSANNAASSAYPAVVIVFVKHNSLFHVPHMALVESQ
jgi:hypothetical protein